MADEKHEHGTMDISVQEKTFAGMVTWTKWVVIATTVVLIFIAIING